MKKNYLVLSSYQKKIPKNYNILYFNNINKNHRNKKDKYFSIPYHWMSSKKFEKDYYYLKKIHMHLLKKISNVLNKIHNENHDLRYWRILLDPFLFYYVSVMFDRWEIINSVVKKYKKISLGKIDDLITYKSPNDFEEFANNINEEDWNIKLFENIINNHFKKNFEFINNFKKTEIKFIEYEKKNKQNKLRSFFKSKIFDLTGFIIKNPKFIFLNVRFSKINIFKLNLYFKNFCFFLGDYFDYKISNFEYSKKNNFMRSKLSKNLNIKANNKFESFLYFNLSKSIPHCLVEDYKNIHLVASKVKVRPKMIITQTGLWTNSIKKMWIAKSSAEGSKILVASHGGSIPVKEHSFDFLNQVCNKKLTWFKPITKKQIQIPSEINEKYDFRVMRQSKKDKLTLILQSRPKWCNRAEFTPISKQFIEFHQKTLNFYKNLNQNIQNKTLIKLYPKNYGWNENQIFKNIKKTSDNSSFNLLKSAKVNICTYPETVFSESMVANIPTVLIFDKNHYRLHNKFANLLKELKKNKIVFHDEVEAARHVNDIWENTENWWQNKSTQKLRNTFLNSCLCYNKRWFNSWVKIISST